MKDQLMPILGAETPLANMPSAEDVREIVEAFPSVTYWLLTSSEDRGFSPFQGFGVDIMDAEYAAMIGLLSILPSSPVEVLIHPSLLPRAKQILPEKTASIIGLASFLKIPREMVSSNQVAVIVGTPSVLSKVDIGSWSPKPIVISSGRFPGATSMRGHTGHPAQLIDGAIREALLARAPEKIRTRLQALPVRPTFGVGTEKSRAAGVTAANESLAMALGYSFEGVDPLDPRRPEYVDAILHSAQLCRDIMEMRSTDTILYAPSIVRHLYKFGSGFWNNLFRKIRSPLRELVRDGVLRNPGYSGFQLELSEPDAVNGVYQDEYAGPILITRQNELRLCAMGIASIASSGMQPAIRLPNAVNFIAADLREIERNSKRDDPRGAVLLRKGYLALSRALERGIGEKILEEVRSKAESITLVTDSPIEWIRIDGLPLMIRHELSRIGMTPGNLMLAQCILSGKIAIPSALLTEILVVRSFANDDPVKSVLEGAVAQYQFSRVKLKVVDVGSRAELLECLNSYSGALVVFDCHGGHGGEDSHGWLEIGTERLDVWTLAHEARIPPIVVLSACSTFALAGSHASVANGLLRSGALTVIGTLLPVNALRSAVFVARLVFRIDQFLPAVKSLGIAAVSWRTLVSALIRMSYATELLEVFAVGKKWLNESMFVRIGSSTNYDINTDRKDWYDRFVRRIAGAAAKSRAEISRAIEEDAPLVESMYYCQIGRPELILVELGLDVESKGSKQGDP